VESWRALKGLRRVKEERFRRRFVWWGRWVVGIAVEKEYRVERVASEGFFLRGGLEYLLLKISGG